MSKNYAVLFSGGGSPYDNFSRYYNSTKSNYEALIKRGLKPENITIAFADGVEINSNFSSDFTTNVQFEHLFGDDLFDANGEFSEQQWDQQWDSLYSEYSISDLEAQTLLRDFVEAVWFEAPDFRSTGLETSLPIDDEIRQQYLANFEETLDKVKTSLVDAGSTLTIKSSRKEMNDGTMVIDLDFYRKNDFSFVKDGTEVIAGTKLALENAVNGEGDSLVSTITNDDNLFVWTFDHGGYGDRGDVDRSSGLVLPSYEGINKADLTAFALKERSIDIKADEFKEIFKDVTLNSNASTFAFAQCFSGGLLQAMLDDPDLAQSSNWFGMAAASQYEVSYGSYFADGVAKGLNQGAITGGELFNIAHNPENPFFAQSPIPNSYPHDVWESWESGDGKRLEHSWTSPTESDLPLFGASTSLDGFDSQGLRLLDSDSLSKPSFAFSFSIASSEDRSLDLLDELQSQFGDLSDLRLEGYTPSKFAGIEYKEEFDSLVYTPLSDFNGDDYFVLRFNDGRFSYDIALSIEVASINDAPIAVDDLIQIASGDRDVLIDVDDQPGFLDDTDVDGDSLFIASYSAPDNGSIEKVGDFLFEYQPNAGFVGSDSFLYVLSDGEAFDVAEVLIDVVDPTLNSFF